ncbi:VCBS repeat-containing protein [Sphingomonas sp. DG1-23]|uniref:FG-GAP repeat domain-containing protein n=1 Tax=Sphingomonas sp. DG1-23 TaxID=3068316 RepID=UPI00273F0A2B|nr:VCBS repeat-containing protein [Sphingomonas sp. DG1-23]MDP5281371.1 VCBS repeat-containing protein [Sphingomonas sp. DG1-23]
MARLLDIVRTGPLNVQHKLLGFTVTFSEPVTGLGIDDFILRATGNIAGASVTGITAVPGTGGASYRVTVQAGVGAGTLSLGVAGEVRDLTGNDAFVPAFEPGIFRAVSNTNYQSQQLAVGDFDQDGKLDMLVSSVPVSEPYRGQVSFLKGRGDGAFEAPVNIITSNTTGTQIAVGDMNGDGRPDLAVQGIINFNPGGSPSDTYLKILLGNGDGTFTSISQTTAMAVSNTLLTLRDVGNDGRADLFTVSQASGQSSLSVRVTGANGVPGGEVRYALPAGGSKELAIADVNGDGKLDAIVGTPGGYSILLGNAGGTFQAALNTSLPNSVRALASGDFNGDGEIDLAIATYDGASFVSALTILQGNGDGTFQQSQALASRFVTSIAVADLNGDGALDIMTAGNSGASMFINNGAAFQPRTDFAGSSFSVIATGDFDNSGTPDIAATAHVNAAGVAIHLQDSAGYRLTVDKDFNGDGRSDILRRNAGGTTDIMEMNGVTRIGGGNTVSQAPNAWKIQDTGDFNADGKADILWRNDSGAFSIWMQNGTQDVKQTGGNVATVWKVEDVADFDGDGTSDVLWRHDDGTSYIWFMHDGTAATSGNTSSQTGNNWKVEAAADFDGDGKGDILWRKDDGTTHLWLMDGAQAKSGSGNTASQLDLNWKIQETGDFNGDGATDILWRHTDGTTRIWLMDGKTQIGGGNTASQAGNVWQIEATGDYNGDGKADILWRHADGSSFIWLMNGTTDIGGGYTDPQIAPDWQIF